MSNADDLLKRGFEGFKGATLDARVQELMDREEIKELTARYAQRVSRRISMADMFTDDGLFVVRMPGQPVQETRGREALEKLFAFIVSRPSRNMPAVHNHVVSVAGDEAVAMSWIELHIEDGEQRTFAGAGYYEDRLKRVGGRWKFAVRDATILVTGPAAKG